MQRSSLREASRSADPMNAPHPFKSAAGVSLVELLVVLAVLAVLATIAIPSLSNLGPASEAAVAGEALERLNRGVNLYEQAVEPLSVAPNSGTADEVAVAALLQTRDAANPGSPYVDVELDLPPGSDTNRFRAVWNGDYFELISPGTNTSQGLHLPPK